MIDTRTTTGYTVATLPAKSLRGNQLSELDDINAVFLKKRSPSIVVRKNKSVILQKTLAYLNLAFVWQAHHYDLILHDEDDFGDNRLNFALFPVNYGIGDRFTQQENLIYA